MEWRGFRWHFLSTSLGKRLRADSLQLMLLDVLKPWSNLWLGSKTSCMSESDRANHWRMMSVVVGITGRRAHLSFLFPGWGKVFLCREDWQDTTAALPQHYHGLNDLIVKGRSPLPFIISAFDLLRATCLLNEMDPKKVNAVMNWPFHMRPFPP